MHADPLKPIHQDDAFCFFSFLQQISYVCKDGLRLESGTEAQNLTCNGGNAWSDPSQLKPCSESKVKVYTCYYDFLSLILLPGIAFALAAKFCGTVPPVPVTARTDPEPADHNGTATLKIPGERLGPCLGGFLNDSAEAPSCPGLSVRMDTSYAMTGPVHEYIFEFTFRATVNMAELHFNVTFSDPVQKSDVRAA